MMYELNQKNKLFTLLFPLLNLHHSKKEKSLEKKLTDISI